MTWRQLLDRADPGSLSRGRDYARRGLVTIRRQDAELVATALLAEGLPSEVAPEDPVAARADQQQ